MWKTSFFLYTLYDFWPVEPPSWITHAGARFQPSQQSRPSISMVWTQENSIADAILVSKTGSYFITVLTGKSFRWNLPGWRQQLNSPHRRIGETRRNFCWSSHSMILCFVCFPAFFKPVTFPGETGTDVQTAWKPETQLYFFGGKMTGASIPDIKYWFTTITSCFNG